MQPKPYLLRLIKKELKINQMKTKVLLLIACLLTTLTGFAITEKTVDGDGNVITKEISISDYNEISTVGVMEFVYEQSDAAPYLKVTIDENLFPLLKIKVEGKELIVSPKRINESGRNGNTYNLNPTTFKVVTNSREIKELNVVSSGDFIIASPMNISKLEINMAGSGNILLKKKVEGNKLEVNLASSGSVVASDIDLRGVECSLAGSGFIQIGGKAEQAEYNLAASGSIKAYDCATGKVECNIAGSGNIQAYAKDRLEANIVGSGNVYYKGDPTTSKSIIGSGKLKKAN